MSILSSLSCSQSRFNTLSDAFPLAGVTSEQQISCSYPYNRAVFRAVTKPRAENFLKSACLKRNPSRHQNQLSHNSTACVLSYQQKVNGNNSFCGYSCARTSSAVSTFASCKPKFSSVQYNKEDFLYHHTLSSTPTLYSSYNQNSSAGPCNCFHYFTKFPYKGPQEDNLIILNSSLFGSRLPFSVKSRLLTPIVVPRHRLSSAIRASFCRFAVEACNILSIAVMASNFSFYGVAALALGGVAVVMVSAASIVAVAVIFQPRWLLKIVRKQMPHIVFDHVTKDPMVALTIDDGPNGETTHQLLDILQESDAKATFFLIGQNIDKYPELRDRMYAEGHELGNHTMEDVASWRLPPADFERALLEVDARLQGFFHHDENGCSMKWFRPGHGWYTRQIRHTIQRHGYRLALGSVYPVDPLFKEKGGPIASYCLWKIYPGAVIVLHDRPQQMNQTIEVLSRMLPELKKRGYQVVTLSQLLKGKENVTKENPLTTEL